MEGGPGCTDEPPMDKTVCAVSSLITFNSEVMYGAQPRARNRVGKETCEPPTDRLLSVSRSSDPRRKHGLCIIIHVIGVAIQALMKSHEKRGEGAPHSNPSIMN